MMMWFWVGDVVQVGYVYIIYLVVEICEIDLVEDFLVYVDFVCLFVWLCCGDGIVVVGELFVELCLCFVVGMFCL